MSTTPETAAPDPAALGAAMAKTMPAVTGDATPAPAAPAAASAAPGAASSATSAPAAAAPAPSSPEVDAKQRPFDPARFLPKKDKNGLWIPKSPGRYGRNGEKRPPAQAPTPTPAASSQAELFGATAGASSPSASSPSSSRAESSSPSGAGSAAAASYIPPETELPPPPKQDAGAPKPETPPEPEAGADDLADVAVDLLSEAVGHVTGAPEEAEPSAREGARLRNVLGAYLRSKGIQTRGLWAVGVAFFAWMLRTAKKPKTRAWVGNQFRGKRPEKPAEAVIEIDPRRPAPGPAAAPAPAAPPPPPPPAAPSERGPATYTLNLPSRRRL